MQELQHFFNCKPLHCFVIDYSFFKIEIQRQKQKFFELNDFMGVPVVFTTVRPFALALSVACNGQRLRRGYSP